jgi:NTE family protein
MPSLAELRESAEPRVSGRDVVSRTGDPLSSPSVGSSATDLITPCRAGRPRRTPLPDATGATIGVALSGGGFRATLAGLGVLQFLADAGLLADVRYCSSVSGGSVANGLFARHYAELEQEGMTGEAFDRIVVRPFVERISTRSFAWSLIGQAWKIVGPKTRTNVLADTFARWFYGEGRLAELPTSCRFVFNSANLTAGVRFTLERDLIGDYVTGYLRTSDTTLRLADAVAASAAFPIAFAPMRLKGLDFPCGQRRPPKLLDGGVYDNMGLEAIDGLHAGELIVALNAGGLFYVRARYGWIPIVRDFLRLNSVLYRQTTAIRRREMVDRFKAWEEARTANAAPPAWARRGVLFGLTTTFTDPDPDWLDARPEHADLIQPLARVKTSFARLQRSTCEQLVYRGWWLTGAALATFHREVLHALPPARSPVT